MEHHRLLLQLLLVMSAFFYATSAGSPSGNKDPTLATNLINRNKRRFVRVLIDCGASQSTSFNDSDRHTFEWLPDGNFTKAGQTFSFSSSNLSYPMNSLRFFPSGSKNCYELSFFYSETKFLFRAGFYYGNYDSLSRPPQFALTIDGHLTAMVDTSGSQEEPVYYELIYMLKRNEVRVCLEQTEKDQVPFISSLEATPMYNRMYKQMDNDTALLLHSRTNYGANQTIEKDIGFYEECCGRVWESKEMKEYINIQARTIPYGSSFVENLPPWAVMATAIQAQSNNVSIRLPVNFSSAKSNNVMAYFVFYFKDPLLRNATNQTSSVDIYIDDSKFGSTIDVPDWFIASGNNVSVVSLYPVRVNGTATVTISPANGTKLPPLLNAMEVFSAIDVSKAGYSQYELVASCFTLFHFIGVITYLYAVL